MSPRQPHSRMFAFDSLSSSFLRLFLVLSLQLVGTLYGRSTTVMLSKAGKDANTFDPFNPLATDHYYPFNTPFGPLKASRSAVIGQFMPLYRDEGSPSISKAYLTSASSYNAVKGGRSTSPKAPPGPRPSYRPLPLPPPSLIYPNSYEPRREPQSVIYPKSYAPKKGPPRKQSYAPTYPIEAAVMTNHKVSFYEVPDTNEPIPPTTIEIGSAIPLINLVFKSASSNLNILQDHEQSKGSYQETTSEDEAHILKHTVTKPIYQEVKETITPYRFIHQELKPVEELITTVVARENGKLNIPPGEYPPSKSNGYQAKTGGYKPKVEPPIVHQKKIVQEEEPQSAPSSLESSQVATVSQRTGQLVYEPVLDPEADLQEDQQAMLAQIHQDYLSSNRQSFLSGVYGISASSTIPHGSERILPQNLQRFTLHHDLVNQYLPLVYEVVNTRDEEGDTESGNAIDEPESQTHSPFIIQK